MIPVNEPLLAKNTLRYVTECVETGWISSAGRFIRRFEEEYAGYLGVKHAVTTTSGTTALHLAMASLGLGPGDAVIIPDLTMIAVPYAVLYTGARPVLVDVEPETYNIDPAGIREYITGGCAYHSTEKRLVDKKTGLTVKAIVPVHLYGHPCAMNEILELARRYNLAVVEDAAEAHGALFYPGGRSKRPIPAGAIGDAGCFSFYGNKIITTGEGGMFVTNHDRLAERARALKDLAHDPGRRFLHTDLGYNYRMTNLQAAVGLAQLEEIDWFIGIKQKMAQTYGDLLAGIKGLTLPQEKPWARSVYWMYAVLVEKEFGLSRDELMERLRERGVDTRTFFIPVHRQPLFLDKEEYRGCSFPVSDDLSVKGLYLPSGLALTQEQIRTVSAAVKEIARAAI
jgi:perosamine synthetase